MLERAMLACAAEGLRRIALYGCGDFLRRCSEALREPPVEIIGFIDDDERRQGRKLWGYPVFCADVALTADLDAVILTAPSVEVDLWRRTAWFRHARIRVLPLTARMDEPASSAAA
jgi:FlaA1/EpsC-like NDP-sugar epimerase